MQTIKPDPYTVDPEPIDTSKPIKDQLGELCEAVDELSMRARGLELAVAGMHRESHDKHSSFALDLLAGDLDYRCRVLHLRVISVWSAAVERSGAGAAA